MGEALVTRHHEIVNRAHDLAADCYWDRVEPSDAQIIATVEQRTRFTLNDHEKAVAVQAYAARWEDWAYGGLAHYAPRDVRA